MKDTLKINPSFQWDVVDYNSKTREYTLKNKVTSDKRVISKERFTELVNEQEKTGGKRR